MDVRRREQLITLGMAVGMAIVFGAILMWPASHKLKDIRKRGNLLREEQARFSSEYELLAPQLTADIDTLKARVNEAIKRVPSQDIRVDFERELRQMGERYNLVGDQYFKASTYERDGSITVRGARLKFQASFMDLYAFLQELESHEKLTIVHALHLEPAPRRDGQFDVAMEVKYFYGEL